MGWDPGSLVFFWLFWGGLGSRISGLGLKVRGFNFGELLGEGLRVQGLGFRI